MVKRFQLGKVQGFDDRLQLQALAGPVPGIGGRGFNCFWLVKQVGDLTDRHTTVEPLQNAFDAGNIVLGVEAMAFRRALGANESIASFPGT